MDFFRACLKKMGAFPFSKATGPELVHEKKSFLGALKLKHSLVYINVAFLARGALLLTQASTSIDCDLH